MHFRINKQVFFLTFISVCMVISNTTGFDFYAHTTIYYCYNQSGVHNTYSVFDVFFFPRYMLLSSIYEILSRIGIPVGFSILVCIVIPVYSIFNYIEKKSNKNSYDVASVVVIFIVYGFCVQYSSLSLVILFMAAHVLTKNIKFIVGSMFHPVGLMLSLIISFIFCRKSVIYILLLLFLMIVLYFSDEYLMFFTTIDRDYLKYRIDLDSIEDLFYGSLGSKDYIFYMICAASLGGGIMRIKFVRFYFNKISKKLISKNFVNLFSLFLMISLNFYMATKSNPNLFYSVITADINEVIYISWFDWGKADVKTPYRRMFNERLIGSGGLDDD